MEVEHYQAEPGLEKTRHLLNNPHANIELASLGIIRSESKYTLMYILW